MEGCLISQKGTGGGGLSVKWWGFFLVRIYFSMEIAVDSVHHPWTAETPVHGGLAVAG
jgi:hypothetical protein